MIEQVGEQLTFVGHFTVSGAAGTGLTITATVYKASDGSTLVGPVAAVELGGGLYQYTLAAGLNTAREEELICVFNEAALTADVSSVPASRWVSPQWLQDIGSATVTVAGPVVTTADTLELVRGDDYLAADSRAISFTSDSWPDLTSAVITMTVRRRREAFSTGSDAVLFTKTDASGLRVVGGGDQTVYFELTPTQSGVLLPGSLTGKYDIEAVLSNDSIVTLVTGNVTVTEDQTRA